MTSTDSPLLPKKQHSNQDRSSRSRSPTREENSTPRNRAKEAQTNRQTDVIIPIREPNMQQIVAGDRIYEFRKSSFKPTVRRIWYYVTAPHSRIDYVCEMDPASHTRPNTRPHPNLNNLHLDPADRLVPDGPPLEEDGTVGTREFNMHHADWEGYDHAYKILSVYKLDHSIPLQELKDRYGLRAPPGTLAYAPSSLTDTVEWRRQTRLR